MSARRMMILIVMMTIKIYDYELLSLLGWKNFNLDKKSFCEKVEKNWWRKFCFSTNDDYL